MESLNQFYEENDKQILLFAAFAALILFTLTLVSDNPELPYTGNETKVCQPNATSLNITDYYDNESKVCWSPDKVDTNGSNGSAENG